MLGIYDTTTQYLDWFGEEKFATPSGLPPPDSTIIRESLLTVTTEVSFRIYRNVSFFCGIFYCFLFPFQFFWHAISIELTVINKMSNLPHKLLRGEAFIRSGFTIRQENIRL